MVHLIEELWDISLKTSNFKIDNKGLLDKIKHFGHNSKMKHIDIKAKKIRELFKENRITVNLVKSSKMIADCLTKACNNVSLQLLVDLFSILLHPYNGGC